MMLKVLLGFFLLFQTLQVQAELKFSRENPGFKEQRAANWKTVLDSKVISYFTYTEMEQDVPNIETDLQIAIQVWLKLLKLDDVKIEKATEKANANIVLHVGKKTLANRYYFSDHPAHTTFIFSWFGKHGYVPLIEMNSNYVSGGKTFRWISVSDACTKNASANIKADGVSKKILVKELFGDCKNPKDIVSAILANKGKITDWNLVEVDKEKFFLDYNVLIHEIGHVFGLKDMYNTKNIQMLISDPTVMGNMENTALYPSAEDLAAVRGIFDL
jgi:hypothetical protein